MRVGYVRVSSLEQNEARQVVALKAYNIEKWFLEKASGKDTNRTEFQNMMNFVREGDTVYILDFSRLTRSVSDLLHTIEELDKKGVKLVSLKENLDTNSHNGKLLLTIIGAINEFERQNILERQREGIALAKSKGVYKGRKPKELSYEVLNLIKQNKISVSEASRRLGVSRATIYNHLKKT